MPLQHFSERLYIRANRVYLRMKRAMKKATQPRNMMVCMFPKRSELKYWLSECLIILSITSLPNFHGVKIEELVYMYRPMKKWGMRQNFMMVRTFLARYRVCMGGLLWNLRTN